MSCSCSGYKNQMFTSGNETQLKFVELTIKKFGGKYKVRGGNFEVVEGEHKYTRNVIVEFESFEKAKAAYNSDDYQAALKALDGGADRDIRIFEGK